MDDDTKFEKDPREKNILQAPRGMRDILPSESVALNKVRDTCREVARIFDYSEIITPIVEDIGVFARTVGMIQTSYKKRCIRSTTGVANNWHSVLRIRRGL